MEDMVATVKDLEPLKMHPHLPPMKRRRARKPRNYSVTELLSTLRLQESFWIL
jgi:hypothetical protein